jgi:ABC-type antimicrobial peptide transport system permease subunit
MKQVYYVFKLAFRNILRHKIKNILIGIILILTIDLILFSDNFRNHSLSSWRSYVSKTFAGIYNISSHDNRSKDYTLTGINFPGKLIPGEIYDYLDSHHINYTRRIRLGGIIYDYNRQEFVSFRPQTVIGCDIAKELKIMTNLIITDGKYDPKVENGILVWKASADKLGLRVGNEVSLFIKDIDNNSYPYTFIVTGLLDTAKNSRLEGARGYDPVFPIFLVSYSYLAGKLGLNEGDSIEVSVWDNVQQNKINLQKIAKNYHLSFYNAENSFSILEGIVSFIGIIGGFICLVVIIILFVSTFNLNMMSFFERQKEIGTMYSIGAKPLWINMLLLCEMFLFSSICYGLSIVLYHILTVIFRSGLDFGALKPGFAGGNFYFSPSLAATIYSYVTIIIVMFLSAWYPVYLTYRINPVDVFNEGNI